MLHVGLKIKVFACGQENERVAEAVY